MSYNAQLGEITQSLQYSRQRQAAHLERFTSQLRFADQLCEAHPDSAAEWRTRILEAGRIVEAGLRKKRIDLDDLVAEGECVLQPIGEVAGVYPKSCTDLTCVYCDSPEPLARFRTGSRNRPRDDGCTKTERRDKPAR